MRIQEASRWSNHVSTLSRWSLLTRTGQRPDDHSRRGGQPRSLYLLRANRRGKCWSAVFKLYASGTAAVTVSQTRLGSAPDRGGTRGGNTTGFSSEGEPRGELRRTWATVWRSLHSRESTASCADPFIQLEVSPPDSARRRPGVLGLKSAGFRPPRSR